jgi:hypothetical protein
MCRSRPPSRPEKQPLPGNELSLRTVTRVQTMELRGGDARLQRHRVPCFTRLRDMPACRSSSRTRRSGSRVGAVEVPRPARTSHDRGDDIDARTEQDRNDQRPHRESPALPGCKNEIRGNGRVQGEASYPRARRLNEGPGRHTDPTAATRCRASHYVRRGTPKSRRATRPVVCVLREPTRAPLRARGSPRMAIANSAMSGAVFGSVARPL